MSMESNGSLKHQRKAPEARREEIIHAAIKLFSERGYARTTTKAIAREAGIAEGTIYKYFPSKRDLLFAFLTPSVLEPLTDMFAVSEGTDDLQVLRALIRNRLALWLRNRPLVIAIHSEALFNSELADAMVHNIFLPVTQMLSAYLARRIAEGVFRPMNTTVAARALLGHLLVNFFFWDNLYETGDEISQETLIDELASLFLFGALRRPADPNPPSSE